MASTSNKPNTDAIVARTNTDITQIKKELDLFYRFFVKLVEDLDNYFFANAPKIEDDMENVLRPQISAHVHNEYNGKSAEESEDSIATTRLNDMTDVEVYNSGLLQYAVHFHENMRPYRYALHNLPDELFLSSTSSFILSPESAFDLGEQLSQDKITNKQRMKIMKYLQNLDRIAQKLDGQIDYDVIRMIIQQDEATSQYTRAQKKSINEFYKNVGLAKATINKITDDKTGTINSAIDEALESFREIQHSMKDDDDENPQNYMDYVMKHKDSIKQMTKNVTNSLGNSIVNGNISTNQFQNIMQSMIGHVGGEGMNMPGEVNFDTIKELHEKHNGNFAEASHFDRVFEDMIANFSSINNEDLDVD